MLLLYAAAPGCAAESGPCAGQEKSIVVDTEYHKMWLCQDNGMLREFKVSIGRGGTNKRRQGDNKTPLGEYSLGEPRLSDRFGVFIPIGYPTQEQQAKGFSGGGIGIHGPKKLPGWLGEIYTWFDWTQGCIAVGTVNAISDIAHWVKERNVNRIIIK